MKKELFTTKIQIPESNIKIDYNSKILALGSCFSENIGNKLKTALFDIDINPFGVLFNPTSILQSIDSIKNKKLYTETDVFNNGSLWSSFSHSTLFSDTDSVRCLSGINNRLTLASENFHNLDFLLITFGTAWIYKHIEKNEIVSNCHKLPASAFERIRLSAETIYASYSQLISQLRICNPKLNIILTVSPVRHWKDGATENHISKGILMDATQKLVANFDNCHYFPAYEIIMDELRDYRFYASDLLHPSEMAINYIFSIFCDTFFEKNTLEISDQIMNYVQAANHRPIHPQSAEYKQFNQKTEKSKIELISKYPFLKHRLI